MSSKSNPLVSIVTPLYNAEKYLAECIESVIAQTYANWNYVIVNNCSTDRSLDIAQTYAKKNSRIRIYTNERFLNALQNLNYSMRKISPDSKYCKVVHADDWMFPECLERMVDVAEKYPSVGIVSAYRLDENQVNLDGLAYPSTFLPGRKICRLSLLKGGPYVFGSPSSLLIRSDLIRQRHRFYNEENIHADKEICYELLKESDFGFVHQVLTFTRRHNEAATTLSKKLNTYMIGKLFILKKYGPIFLSADEYKLRWKRKTANYHTFLVQSIFDLKDKHFFQYHINELAKLDVKINPIKLIIAFIKELLNPLDAARRLRGGLKQRFFSDKNG